MLGYMTIGLAIVSAAPASFARDSQVLGHCKPAATAIEAEERQTHQNSMSNAVVVVAVPIGRVCVGPESVDGEPSYVRRTTDGKGITVVEVSTTPFMPDLPTSAVAAVVIGRPDQPAGW